MGAIVTFCCAKGSLALGLPVPVDSQFDPQAIVVAGVVKHVGPLPPVGPGKIPTAAVTVEGRTGKRVVIDGARCYLRTWDSWDEAVAFVAQARNGVTVKGSPSMGAGRKLTP